MFGAALPRRSVVELPADGCEVEEVRIPAGTPSAQIGGVVIGGLPTGRDRDDVLVAGHTPAVFRRERACAVEYASGELLGLGHHLLYPQLREVASEVVLRFPDAVALDARVRVTADRFCRIYSARGEQPQSSIRWTAFGEGISCSASSVPQPPE